MTWHATQSRRLAMAEAIASESGLTLKLDIHTKDIVINGGVLLAPPLDVIASALPRDEDQEAFFIGGIARACSRYKNLDEDLLDQFVLGFSHHPAQSLVKQVATSVIEIYCDQKAILDNRGTELGLKALRALQLAQPRSVVGVDASIWAFEHLLHASANALIDKSDESEGLRSKSAAQFESVTSSTQALTMIQALGQLDQVDSTESAISVARSLLSAFGIEASQFQESGAAEDSASTAPGDSKTEDSPGPVPVEGAEGDVQPTEEAAVGGDPQAGQNGSGSSEAESSQAASSGSAIDDDSSVSLDEVTPESVDPAGELETAADEEVDVPLLSPHANGEEAKAAVAVEQSAESLDKASMLVAIAGIGGTDDLASSKIKVMPSRGQILRERVQSHTMLAIAKLSHLLKAETECTTRIGKSGKLIPSKLWRVKTGNMNVFRSEIEGKAHSTAIEVLLDRSSSMQNDMQTALDAMAFVSLAMDAIEGVSVSNHVYPGAAMAAVNIKRFDQRIAEALEVLAGVHATGGTPMHAALKQVIPSLMENTAERKVLIHITDGEPSQSDFPKIAELVRQLESGGVEVIAIGIGSGTLGSLRKMFPNSVAVNDVTELTDALYRALTNSFTKQLAA